MPESPYLLAEQGTLGACVLLSGSCTSFLQLCQAGLGRLQVGTRAEQQMIRLDHFITSKACERLHSVSHSANRLPQYLA